MNRIQARENAFLLLFESVSRKDVSPREIYDLAVSEREMETDEFVDDIFFGIEKNIVRIEEVISAHLVGWKSERVSAVSMALCRLAAYEMLFRDDIPCKVSINEAIELSKKYDDEKSYVFVNGVLNAIAKEIGKE